MGSHGIQKKLSLLLCISLLLSLIIPLVQPKTVYAALSYPLQDTFESYGTTGQAGSIAPIGTAVTAAQPWKNDFGSGAWTIDEETIPGTANKNHYMKQTTANAAVITDDYWGQSNPEITSSSITVSGKVKVTGGTSIYAGIIARYAPVGSSLNYYRFNAKKNSSSYQFYIEKAYGTTGNSKTTVPQTPGTTNASGVSIPNTSLTSSFDSLGYLPLKMNVINNPDGSVLLECYYGNTLVLSATDPVNATPYLSGQVGLYTNAGATAFDDLQATPYAPPVVTPAVTKVDGDSSADLMWTVALGNSYDVKRKGPGESTYTVVAADVAHGALPGPFTYTASGLTNSATYSFIVTARNDSGQSADSASIDVTPQPLTTPPGAPASLSASQINNNVTLQWPSVNGSKSYNVYRSTAAGGPFNTPLATGIGQGVISPTLSYTDNGLTQGIYYYIVTGVNPIGEGSPSPTAAIGVNPPAPPASITTTLPGTGSVRLSWTASSNASSYNVKIAATSGGPYTQVNTTPITSTNFTVSNLNVSQTYYFKLSAVNAVGEGADSAAISAVPDVVVKPPVHNSTELNAALAAAVAGDVIVLEDGSYTSSVSINGLNGTADNPIVIKAKNKGMAKFNTNGMLLTNSSYITIQDMEFSTPASTWIRLTGSNHIRITNNYFHSPSTVSASGSSLWILIDGANSHHNRIDHNLMENKLDQGKFIEFDGVSSGTGRPYEITQYDLVEYNIFRNTLSRQPNESESIRLGVSQLSIYDAHATIQYNIFDHCDADPEIVSVKSGANTIRYNYFIESLGTLSLRQGNNSSVYGNYFIGNNRIVPGDTPGSDPLGTGGIRIYGENHKIYNNYFQSLTGSKWDAPITITTGEKDDIMNNLSSLSAHFIAKNITLANNTLVNNGASIELGYERYGMAPQNINFANNLVVGSQKELIKIMTPPVNLTWQGNMMFPQNGVPLITGTPASLTNAQVAIVNPLMKDATLQLSQSDYSWLWRDDSYARLRTIPYKKLSGASPAIDASTGTYEFVTEDMEHEARVGIPDVGADEYSGGSGADLTPPAWTAGQPLALSAVKPRQIQLQWQAATDDTSIVAYNIYQNNALIDSVFGDVLSYTARSLQPGTAYSFKIEAVDEGNYKAVSNTVTGTTPSLTGVSVSGVPAEIALGGSTKQLIVTGQFSDASTEDDTVGATFTSSNLNALTVSASGAVTAVGQGSSNLTASYQGITSLPLTITVKPSGQVVQVVDADTYVDGVTAANADTNYNSQPELLIKNSGGRRDGYLKVTLPSIVDPVDSVKLRLYTGTVDSGADLQVYGLVNDAWDPAAITYNNQPDESLSDVYLGKVAPLTSNSAVTFDVTKFYRANADSVLSFRIRMSAADLTARVKTLEGTDINQAPALIYTTISNQAPLPGLDAPTGLSAQASDAKVTLTWNGVSGATSYNILRSTTSGSGYAQAGTSGTTSFTDSSVNNATTYYYVVQATDSVSVSPNSVQVSAKPQASVSGTLGLLPSDDVVIDQSSPTTVYNTMTSGSSVAGNFNIRRTSSSQRIAFYRFNVADAASVSEARFRIVGKINTATPTPPTLQLYGTTLDGAWTENDFTWNQSSSYQTGGNVTGVGTTAFLLGSLALPANNASYNEYVVDVTSFVRTYGLDGKVTFMLLEPSGANVSTTFYSKESQASTYPGTSPYPELRIVTSSAPSAPGAPTGLNGTAGSGQVTLSWTAPAGSTVTSYNVKRSTGDGAYTVVASNLTSLTYTDKGLTNGVAYTYVVSAVNGIGEGANSTSVTSTPTPPATVPSAPTGLTAVGGSSRISLSWQQVDDATSYSIWRSTVNGSGYVQVGTTSVASYSDLTVINSIPYYYVVQAVNEVGASVNSAQVSAIAVVPPGGNFDLSHWKLTLPDQGASEISAAQLQAGYSGPYFYTDPQDGAMTFWAPVNGGTTSGSSYPRSELREMINPTDDNVNWSWLGNHTMTATERVTVVPSTGKVIALQIHGVTASGGSASPLVKMQYDSNKHAVDFLVKALAAGGSDIHYVFNGIQVGDSYSAQIQVVNGVLYMTVNGVTQSHDFIAADPNWKDVLFYFKAGAYTQDNVGDSSEGGMVKIYSLNVTHQAALPPAAPEGLTAALGSGQVGLSWTPVSGATSYTVLRSTTSGSGYTVIGTSLTGSYTDAAVASGTTYYYAVTASSAAGTSGLSAEQSATLPPADTTAPMTTDDAPQGWVNHDVVVHLTASDLGSGVADVFYTVDSSVRQTGTQVTLNTEGVHTITYWSVDRAGNSEAVKATTVRIDKTPSEPTASASTVNGQNGWYTSDPAVTLTATDALSGVQRIRYRVDNGVWADYSQPVTISTEGIHSFEYKSMDNAGNESAVHAMPIKLDKTGPSLTVSVDPVVLWPANHKLVTVNAAVYASDSISSLAGVVLTSITVNEPGADEDIQGAQYGTLDLSFSLRAEKPDVVSERIYSITYTATDQAGNKKSVSVVVKVPRNNSGN
ncbi:polysaccharide lyase family 7 protein [Paenibacillus cremeus]|uniref:DNRLRE domain-containing protein n=1 Tax=Paenibacillus cremeus TaxID=2163881 RepID=A0A559K5W6_9BACL|nr:polysaccharide lyase family 7 protein [Paenibacillus cremeus]TVY07500.1 DNRLRE domain-containing protein [Paenibacillus cremeus]